MRGNKTKSGVCAVYGVRCVPTGRVYVGATTDTYRRFAQHRGALRRDQGGHTGLLASWREHGEAAHVFEVLEVVRDPRHLHSFEQSFMDYYGGRGLLLNVGRDARRPTLGVKYSEESKAKMRGQPHRMRSGAAHPSFGKQMTHASRIASSRARGCGPIVDQHGTRYETLSDAARAIGVTPAQVHGVLNGRCTHTHGWVFRYLSEGHHAG